TMAYKKTVGAKPGEEGPRLETNIEYYTNSGETGKYGKEKKTVPSGGNWERYDYDSTGRKIKIEKAFKNAVSTATSGIVTIEQSYGSVDANDTPLANDTRPRIIEEKVHGTTIKKLYFAYYTNVNNEKVEITEAASASAAAYGTAGNARKTIVYYAPNATAPAAGRMKYVIYPVLLHFVPQIVSLNLSPSSFNPA
ncbi:MAG: hypothetical protein PHV82_18755, partial [Victivallaceae bacterium]|nr:hypothetical protein [Victivallaceae bacterium]